MRPGQVVTRTAKDGTKSYQVKWRHAVDRTWQTVTRGDYRDANALRGAVELRRHMVGKDDADVLDWPIVTGLETRSAALLFGVVAEEYISGRRRASADTKHRNRARVARHRADWTARPVDVIDEPDVHAVRKPTFLEPAEAGLVVDHAAERIKDPVRVYLKTGLRYGELTGLHVEDFVRPQGAKGKGTAVLDIRQAAKMPTVDRPEWHIRG